MTTHAPATRIGADDRGRRYDIARLKREHPLAATVAAYGVRLRRVGDGVWQGRCPLPGHDDRTPSFTIYERDGRFKCFGGGCGAHGDVIDFVRLMERLPDFPAACAHLSAAGGPSHALPGQPRPRSTRRWDALTLTEQEVMNEAARHYQEQLRWASTARAYLRERRIADHALACCGVGFVPGGTLAATLAPGERELALGLGLLYRGAGKGTVDGWGEMLAGRVVVPELRDGNCLWLIGRALPGAPTGGPWGGKYRALRGERPVLGYAHAAGRPESLLCEGVLDWLTAIGWGLPAWSPCGTQLPATRLGFLAATQVVFGAFDADTAGRAAARRFAALLGSRFRPLALPEGHDLNDLARLPDGRARFLALLDAARCGATGRSPQFGEGSAPTAVRPTSRTAANARSPGDQPDRTG